MTRDKGNRAAHWVAGFVRAWWPHAEATANGRSGRDIQNTPGVAWEVKTAVVWRNEWLEQAKRNAHGALPVVAYLPPGCGAANVGNALCIIPLRELMAVLEEAGYAPERRTPAVTEGNT